MKNVKIALSISLYFLFFTTVFSQEDTDITIENIQVTNKMNVEKVYLNTSNDINIVQIGIDNSIYTEIISNDANIEIYQNGARNRIQNSFTSNHINAVIIQNGDDNYYQGFTNNNETPIDFKLIQEGNELKFIGFGTNSITKDLKVLMKGTGKTVIIRSFN